jgi:hypothetical protein
MLFRLFIALAALCLPAAAHAHEMEGRWALRIGETNIFVFAITRADDGEWHGTWTRPDRFASNGAVFARMEGSRDVRSSAGIEFAGDIELTFDDPAPGAIPDIFRFRHLGPGLAQMTYVGTPLAPYPLVAVPEGSGLGPFVAGVVYDRDNAVTDPGAVPVPPPPPPPVAEPQPERLRDDFLEGL